MRKSLLFSLVVLSAFVLPYTVHIPTAQALSTYGRACDNNDDCVDCKKDEKCLICMNSCYNLYGNADDEGDVEKQTSEQRCKKKQAKWCNAQCWDPDDMKIKGYESTKPQCTRAF